MTTSYLSHIGPSDPLLKRSEAEGYQPISRIGEIVINGFIDAYEFGHLRAQGDESKPHFHEWASVLPGMILVSRKKRTESFRQFSAAESAMPVIGSSACLVDIKNKSPKVEDIEAQFFFAGICRSKSVREIDDGLGPKQGTLL